MNKQNERKTNQNDDYRPKINLKLPYSIDEEESAKNEKKKQFLSNIFRINFLIFQENLIVSVSDILEKINKYIK